MNRALFLLAPVLLAASGVVCPAPALADAPVEMRVRFAVPSPEEPSSPAALEQSRANLEEKLGLRVQFALPAPAGRALRARSQRGAQRTGGPDTVDELLRWARVSVPGHRLSDALAQLEADASVDRIEAVPVAELCALVPDDPLLRNQQAWVGYTGLQEAWAAARSETAVTVRVAVVDGGTEWSHPDLLANVALNEADAPDDGIDQDGNGYVDDHLGWNFPRGDGDPSAIAGQSFNARHGTHVAGIIGGVLGNGIGIAGAGGNPELLLINAAHPTIDGGIGYGYEGILYAIARGADIINCSWRTARYLAGKISDAPYSQFEVGVLRLARESGVLVVAAAGNDASGDIWTTPAGYEGVLSVTATATVIEEQGLWPRANSAPWIDLAAPGYAIASTFPEAQAGTLGAYGLLNGTSMSAAVVSGVAALVKRDHPEWSLEQLESRLKWSAADIGLDEGFRVVRADRALDSTEGPDLQITVRGLADADGDGIAEGGEIIDLKYDIGATFSGQVGVTVQAWTEDPWLVPLIDRMTLPSVPVGGVFQVLRGLKFWVRPSAPPGHIARVQLQAVVEGTEGPIESGTVVLRPLSVSVQSDGIVASAAANGALGQATPVVSEMVAPPALGRAIDAVGFLKRGGLLLGNAPDRVSDALLPRGPVIPYKDFFPQPDGLSYDEGGAGPAEIRLAYKDRGSPLELGVSVRQRERLYSLSAEAGFVLLDYEVGVFETAVRDLRWGLALDWSVPTKPGDPGGGRVAERLVAREDGRGLRVEAATAGSGNGVAGVLVLGKSQRIGLSGFAYWSTEDDVGWNTPGDPGETIDDATLWERMAPGIDEANLAATGDRVAVISGELGTVEVGEQRKFAVALAIAPDEAELERVLERARLTWEAAEIGRTPSELSTGWVSFSRNPFRSDTELLFALAEPGPAVVEVFDLRGRRVRTLLDEFRRAGIHRVRWDGRDGRGAGVASGVYYVRLRTSAGTSSQPITRVR